MRNYMKLWISWIASTLWNGDVWLNETNLFQTISLSRESAFHANLNHSVFWRGDRAAIDSVITTVEQRRKMTQCSFWLFLSFEVDSSELSQLPTNTLTNHDGCTEQMLHPTLTTPTTSTTWADKLLICFYLKKNNILQYYITYKYHWSVGQVS